VRIEGGTSVLGPVLRQQPNLNTPSRVIRSGETVEYPYFVAVSEKSIYRVSFWVKLTDEEYAVHVKSGGKTGDIYWAAQAFVVAR
jgi:hypothetical protein